MAGSNASINYNRSIPAVDKSASTSKSLEYAVVNLLINLLQEGAGETLGPGELDFNFFAALLHSTGIATTDMRRTFGAASSFYSPDAIRNMQWEMYDERSYRMHRSSS